MTDKKSVPTNLLISSMTLFKLLKRPFKCSIIQMSLELSHSSLSFGYQRKKRNKKSRRRKLSNWINLSQPSLTWQDLNQFLCIRTNSNNNHSWVLQCNRQDHTNKEVEWTEAEVDTKTEVAEVALITVSPDPWWTHRWLDHKCPSNSLPKLACLLNNSCNQDNRFQLDSQWVLPWCICQLSHYFNFLRSTFQPSIRFKILTRRDSSLVTTSISLLKMLSVKTLQVRLLVCFSMNKSLISAASWPTLTIWHKKLERLTLSCYKVKEDSPNLSEDRKRQLLWLLSWATSSVGHTWWVCKMPNLRPFDRQDLFNEVFSHSLLLLIIHG